ncbi:NIF3-like protein 1 isoform X2 [Sipha flava]|uniref:NIF3-like protein 1 n=1 Tax=Sipha flava TaxID=143950 RepID=A0A8B8F3M4_9HEMI|nr:NIF3-like protein 1 isoform X2 [Sipha flava]
MAVTLRRTSATTRASGSLSSHCVFNQLRNISKMANLKEVVSTLEKMAPLSLAESWDNVGLLIEPDVKKSIECVFLTNDLTEDVLEEAQNAKANLIISYHPPLFKPFKRIILKNWKDRITSRCLSQGIAVYSPHTSWDAVKEGLTDWLISCFDGSVTVLQPHSENPEFSHIVTVVSDTCEDSPLIVVNAFMELYPQFKLNNDLKILSTGHTQLKLLCNSNILSLFNEMTKYHYMSAFVQKNEMIPETDVGTGRLCHFREGLTIRNVIQRVKCHLKVNNLMVALARGSTLESTINSAATVAGSGASVLNGVNADLYLTGEMSHHEILDAVHNNVTVILANHSNTERGYLKVFADNLSQKIPQLRVCISNVDRDPLLFV